MPREKRYDPSLNFCPGIFSVDLTLDSGLSTLNCPEALGIPFVLLGAAEKKPQYQSVIQTNNLNLKHLWGTLEHMVCQRPCILHPQENSCSVGRDTSLGVTGSPCNPYSTQRCKRFQDGDVAAHTMHNTTIRDVVSYYQVFQPHAGITEQVKGFGMATSSQDSESPLQKLLY